MSSQLFILNSWYSKLDLNKRHWPKVIIKILKHYRSTIMNQKVRAVLVISIYISSLNGLIGKIFLLIWPTHLTQIVSQTETIITTMLIFSKIWSNVPTQYRPKVKEILFFMKETKVLTKVNISVNIVSAWLTTHNLSKLSHPISI